MTGVLAAAIAVLTGLLAHPARRCPASWSRMAGAAATWVGINQIIYVGEGVNRIGGVSRTPAAS